MPLSFDDEQRLYSELSQWESRRSNLQYQSSQQLSDLVERLGNNSPYAPPEIVLPAAQAVRDGRLTEELALDMLDSATRVEIENTVEDQQQVDNRSAFRRVLDFGQDAVKTGSRWGIAALEFVPQVVTNAASRVYMSGENPAGKQQGFESQDPNSFIGKPTTGAFDLGSLWQSTDLGAMFGGEAGSGYFIGEAAKERQEEAAQAYRGTIGGEAFTLGKGVALSFSQPGSRAFNIASGLVDATAAIAIPSIPGGKVASRAISTQAGRAGARSLAGLTNFAEPYIQPQRFAEWADTKGARKIFRDMTEIDTISKAKQAFPNADARWWNDVTTIGSRTDLDETQKIAEVRQLLADPVRGIGMGPGLTDTRQINLGGRDAMRRGRVINPTRSRLAAPRVKGELVLSIDDPNDLRAATDTVKSAEAYLRTARVEQGKIDTILGKIAGGLTSGDRALVSEALQDIRVELIDQISSTKGFRKQQSKDFVALLFKKYDEDIENYRNFYLFGDTVEGSAKVHEGLVGRLPGAEDLVGDLKVSGIAQTATEVAKWSTFLPDIRKVRRATSQYSWFFSPDAKVASAIGDPRTYISALDFVQNQMWRPLTLLTGGYRLRNMIESTFFRTPTIRGIDSGPTHPFEWMMMLTGKKYVGDLDGNELNQVGQQFAGRAGRAWREATGSVPREVMSESGQLEMAYRGGYYALAKKTRDNPDYVRGVANEIRLLAGDDVARRLADELSVDEVLEELKTTEWGRRYVDLLVSRHKQVMLDYTDEAGKTVRKRGDIIYKYTDDAGVEQYTESLDVFVRDMLERVQRSTGNNETLRRIIANTDGELGRFVTFDGKQTQAFRQTVGSGAFPNDEYEMFDYTDEFLAEIGNIWKVENEMLEAGTDLGQNVLPNFVKFVKPIDLQDLGVGTRGQWWRTTMNHFFGQVFGKPEAFLNRSPVFRAAYYRKVNDLIEANLLSREGYEFIVQNVTTSVRKNVDSRLRMLEQLKPDAKGMYRWNDQLISKSKYERVLNGARKDAENANKYVKVVQKTDPVTGRVYDDFVVQPEFDKYAARWVGSEDLWRTISSRLRDPSTPFEGLAGDQVSFAAKAFAMEQTKQAFYNAAETSNFADIMRIAVPFGPAWGEAMRFYVKEIAKDPERIKKAAVSVQGFRDMDPDNDGKGFIFQDPVTGEMVFNYPLDSKMLPFLTAFAGSTLLQTFARGGAPSAIAGAAIGAATGEGLRRYAQEQTGGLDVALQAPAQSLSQSFQVLPGFGPVVQFAATQIMGDRPQFDDVMSVVAPFGAYGSPTAALVPSWAQKITQALTADPDNDRFFGDLYIDTYRAMYASGEYDNTNPESMQLLRQRARRAAGALLTLRGLGQFTGPARPELELRVPTKYEGEVTVNDITQMVKGNITSSMLAATFRQMQEEDYENAVQNFLRTFGADMMLYLPGLSNTEVKGLQATDMFGDWERNNRDLTEKFPLVYGYFAPDGGEFELQTYLRQIREKKRTKITDPQDLQRDAEAVVGRALYMDAVRMAGLNPSPADEARLKALRQEIGDRLPGFAISPINIREQAQIMLQIENATSDPDLDGNPVAEASRVYFRYRQQAIDEAMRRSGGVFTEGLLSRKDNADLRQWLRKTGDVLMTQYPEFQRLYARVLFDEVDL